MLLFRRIALLLFTAATACVTAVDAATFLAYTSQAGDPIGKGVNGMLGSDPGVRWTATINSRNHVVVTRGTDMYLEMSWSGGAANATRFGHNGGPSLDFSMGGVACDDAYGGFTVYEIEYHDSTIDKLAADFQYHCDGADPGFFGYVRYNSSVPYAPMTDPPVIKSATITVSSLPTDALLHGERARLTNDQALIRKTLYGNGGVRITYGPDPAHPEWSFILSPAGSDLLAPGTYDTSGGGFFAQLGRKGNYCYGHARAVVHGVAFIGVVVTGLSADIQFACNNDPAVMTTFVGIRYGGGPPYVDPLAPPVVTSVTGKSSTGTALTLSMNPPGGDCTISSYNFVRPESNKRPALPDGFAAPYGYVDLRADNCAQMIGSDISQWFIFETGEPLPATAQWWSYSTPRWYRERALATGNKIGFSVIDGKTDVDLVTDGSLPYYGALVVPGGLWQDLWWAGTAENGWGMSIVQHRDALFINFFVYDEKGKPVWYVMPSGEWNSAHTAYTGNLYLPRGSPYFNYDVSKFNVGPRAGDATVTFANSNSATLDFVVNFMRVHKNISRVGFGPLPVTDDNTSKVSYADLWWGGVAQNGWGVALLKQYNTFFGLWYTYDANGDPTWFVMPAITGNDSFLQGKVYSSTGYPWIYEPYMASWYRTTEVGSFVMRFDGANAINFDYTINTGIDTSVKGSVPLTRIPF